VTSGQDLVLKLYNAVLRSPNWSKTMLVVTYDEHGGFFDHVQPGPAEDDFPDCRRYGVRVPAIVVSPWVEAGAVSNTVFDHTSIIKTILLRFCAKADGSIPNMGARVAAATHLGELLSRGSARPPTPPGDVQPLVDHIADWRQRLFKNRVDQQIQGDLPVPKELSDLEKQALDLKRQLIGLGAKNLGL